MPGSLHLEIGRRAFRRYSTYTAATLAGVFTNCVFGVIVCFAYLAVWAESPRAGGYDATDAVTYAWLGQAMLMTVALWGGGSTDELADRIRSGDVAIDLYRPVGLLGWYLAADLGRAAYHLLSRGLAPMLVGASLFDLRWPASSAAWLAVLASLPLAVAVSFGIRFLVACTTFWLLDHNGPRILAGAAALFFSGLTVPLVLFPGWVGDLAFMLPWAAYLQVPADIWLGQRAGAEVLTGLAFQAAWAAVLLLLCGLAVRAARHRVVVQGG